MKTYFFVFMLGIIGISLCTSCTDQNFPNVVLIVVDDLGYADISCSELAEDVKTPNIDKLAEAGVRFTNAYATSPICSPSRSGLITGAYQQRWGTYWYGGPGIHDSCFRTIAEILKNEAYETGYIGKIHYGGYDDDTANRSFPLNHGFDYFYGFTSPRKHYLIHDQEYEDHFQEIKKAFNRQGQSLRQQGMWVNTRTLDTLAFSTEMFGKEACRFIENNRDHKFFLQLSFNAVHNFTHQLPQNYLDSLGLKGYSDWDPAVEEYYDWYRQGRYPNNPEGRAHYLGQLHYLDREIGRVLNCLKTLNLDEHTLVIFISDNGGSTPIYANNFPLRGSKYVLYEGGIRVPVIMSWPNKYMQDTVVENVISAMDILPTVCRAAGMTPPENIDGMDISTLLTGFDRSLEHDTLVWDTHHEKAVRAGKWKWHLVLDNRNATYEMVDVEVGEFLYDLEVDPAESVNLITTHPEVARQLKHYYAKWTQDVSENH
ncbi:MAG: sulfatase-like hydrolase/transferase [Bacteroidetes bacterium]|nr:sulfatase-like hydrolase/transferase [Bacteroidota bacterium]